MAHEPSVRRIVARYEWKVAGDVSGSFDSHKPLSAFSETDLSTSAGSQGRKAGSRAFMRRQWITAPSSASCLISSSTPSFTSPKAPKTSGITWSNRDRKTCSMGPTAPGAVPQYVWSAFWAFWTYSRGICADRRLMGILVSFSP